MKAKLLQSYDWFFLLPLFFERTARADLDSTCVHTCPHGYHNLSGFYLSLLLGIVAALQSSRTTQFLTNMQNMSLCRHATNAESPLTTLHGSRRSQLAGQTAKAPLDLPKQTKMISFLWDEYHIIHNSTVESPATAPFLGTKLLVDPWNNLANTFQA